MKPRPAFESRHFFGICRIFLVAIYIRSISAGPFSVQRTSPFSPNIPSSLPLQVSPTSSDLTHYGGAYPVTTAPKAKTPRLVFFPYTVPIPWPTPFNGTAAAPVPKSSPPVITTNSELPDKDTYPVYIPVPQFEYVPLYYNAPSAPTPTGSSSPAEENIVGNPQYPLFSQSYPLGIQNTPSEYPPKPITPGTSFVEPEVILAQSPSIPPESSFPEINTIPPENQITPIFSEPNKPEEIAISDIPEELTPSSGDPAQNQESNSGPGNNHPLQPTPPKVAYLPPKPQLFGGYSKPGYVTYENPQVPTNPFAPYSKPTVAQPPYSLTDHKSPYPSFHHTQGSTNHYGNKNRYDYVAYGQGFPPVGEPVNYPSSVSQNYYQGNHPCVERFPHFLVPQKHLDTFCEQIPGVTVPVTINIDAPLVSYPKEDHTHKPYPVFSPPSPPLVYTYPPSCPPPFPTKQPSSPIPPQIPSEPQYPLTPLSKQPARPAQQPSRPAKQPARPTQQPAQPTEQPSRPTDRPIDISGRSSPFKPPATPPKDEEDGYIVFDPTYVTLKEGDGGDPEIVYEPETLTFYEGDAEPSEFNLKQGASEQYVYVPEQGFPEITPQET